MEHAINETEKPLRVNSECIYKREGRMGIDRVKDAVEQNLHSEVDNIRNVQNNMKDTLNNVSILFLNLCIITHKPKQPEF